MKLHYYTSVLPSFSEEEMESGLISIEAISPQQWKVSITLHEDDGSYRYRGLMEKTQLVLKFSLPYYVDFPIGTFCVYMAQTFSLGCPANFKKNGSRIYEYTLNMGTRESSMADYKLHNSVDGRLKWSMCAKPHEFIEEIVKNLNEREGANVWSVGECIDAAEKTIEFNHTFIDAALQSVASTFDTEYEISESFAISLHKVEYFKDDPLPLAYGRGNGFVPGVGRTSQSDEKPVKRLYVEGSDRNIDRSTYGAAELRLPKGKTLQYDGEHFQTDKDENGNSLMEAGKAHTYSSDENGTYIFRSDVISDAVKEESIDCTEIYPSREGKVSSLVTVDAENNFYDIIDSSIPDDLDFSECLIAGETMTIVFQSGMLAGKEFDVKYYHASKVVNGVTKAAKRFEIVPQEYDGVIMPNETFKPAQGANGDTYAVFGIQLPEAYLCNDATRTGASWEMFKEAARWLYEHEEQKFTFAGELQGIWAKKNWLRVGGYMKVGAYIRFKDEHFAKGDGVVIRIVGIKDFLTAPYSPQIEISNTISAASTTSDKLRDMEGTEVVIGDTKRDVINFTKRRFRDAKETMAMLNAALNSLSDEYTGAISPISVKTMQILLGDESLQFQFVQSLTNLTRVPDTMGYSQSSKRFGTTAVSYIQHLTIGISDLSSEHKASEYLKWRLPVYTSPVLDDGSKSYYVYAVCKQAKQTGYFMLSETAKDLVGKDADNDDCYNLLCGVLNKEYDGERSFVSLYGFTEILPGRITTDRVVSGDGESFFDMVKNSFKLGEHLQYNVDDSHELRLKGAIVQSPSGDEFYIPCYRGAYSLTTQYYAGDTVTYNTSGTSTYLCIKDCKGEPPTNATYWRLQASQGSNGTNGANGDDGKEISSITQEWMLTTTMTKPAASNANWSSSIPTPSVQMPYLWVKTTYTYSDDTKDVTITLSAVKGATGQKGDTGAAPGLVYRGDYDENALYYGYSKRLDCVRYNSTYWVAVLNDTIGTQGFSGQTPGASSTYWANFGSSFESVATNLLLAEMANIGGWIMKDNRLISQIGTIDGAISNDYADENFIPAIILDAVNGEIWQGDNILVNGDGICLFANDGNVAAKIVNESIGNEADLSETTATKTASGSGQSESIYNPYSGSTRTTIITRTIELGYFSNGSQIKVNSGSMSFTLPSNQNSNVTMYYPTMSFKIEILRGWTVVKTIGMTQSSSGHNPGDYVAASMSTATSITIDGSTYAPGQYRIRVRCDLQHNSSNGSGISNITDLSYSCNYYFNKTGMQKTLIGSDGMYSCWGNQKYFFTSADGIILRHGNYVLKLSNAGIQKSTDGGTNYSAL